MHFDYKPELRGSLLSLRPLREEDFEALYAVACDPMLWEQHPEPDRHKREVFQCFFDDAVASGTAFVATDTATGKVIGTSRYHGCDTIRSEIEIGWTFLSRCCWGGEYNREMKRLMLEHAYRFVDNVVFVIGADNIRSQQAVRKIGATLIDADTMRADRKNVIYRLASEEFERLPVSMPRP